MITFPVMPVPVIASPGIIDPVSPETTVRVVPLTDPVNLHDMNGDSFSVSLSPQP